MLTWNLTSMSRVDRPMFPFARSPGGVTIALERDGGGAAVEWAGNNARNRRLRGLTIRPRVISPRAAAAVVASRPTARAATAAG